MNQLFNRRGFGRVVAASAAGSLLSRVGRASPRGNIRDVRTVSPLKHRYHGWPTVARRNSGELLLVCSGGRESHVCPFGRVDLMRSHDNGETWTWPETVLDGPIDDRDAGVVETAQGTLLVTTFTSLAYADILEGARPGGDWSDERLARWRAAHNRVSQPQRQAALGVWMTRSTDGGVTWSGRFDSRVNSPHGPIALGDGRLLYAGKDLWREPNEIGVCVSDDDGQSWQWLSRIPTRPGDDHRQYHELHAVEAATGALIAHIRNHNRVNEREILQSESQDGGKTWSVPRAIGVWGLPSHLLRLADDRLLMSYGHRRDPLGNLARISEDHGQTWSDPITISRDAVSGDLGYPSTVQLSDGSLLTVWYEKLAASPLAQLRQARWELGD